METQVEFLTLVMERDYREVAEMPASRRYKLIHQWIARQDAIRKKAEADARQRRARGRRR